MVLSEIDRSLLDRCLQQKPRAWEDFVDRFLGLITHVVHHTAQAQGARLSPEDRDDLCAEVLLNIIKDDFAILRRFRGQSSLATYLTVVARRIIVRQMLKTRPPTPANGSVAQSASPEEVESQDFGAPRLEDREEIDRLLGSLEGVEAVVVRMFHLEGKTYREISLAVGLSENSIGPMLSRARQKLRQQT